MVSGGALLMVLLPVAVVLVVFGGAASALQCLKCGQYNDGVGSITPCINYTHMQLIECPSLEQKYCIKYISEGSTVRDCVVDCIEKESWSQRTYCCKEDGCNSATETTATLLLLLPAAVLTFLAARIH